MFTDKKRKGINRFVCDVSLYVAKTPKASIKYHKLPLPVIPFGIVAYGFVGQPFSKQLYTCGKRGKPQSRSRIFVPLDQQSIPSAGQKDCGLWGRDG